jgi:hypothetical protein
MLATADQADVAGYITIVGLLLMWFVGPVLGCVVAWVSVTRNRPMRRWKLAAILLGLVGWLAPSVWFAISLGPHYWVGDGFFLAFFAMVAALPSLTIGFPLARDLWLDRPRR